MTVAIHRHAGRQLYPAALKPLEIRWPKQLAVEPWRRNLQNVRAASDRVLDIEDRADLAAHVGAIFVRNPGRLVDEDAQHAGLAAASQFDLDYLKALRSGNPLHDGLHFLEI